MFDKQVKINELKEKINTAHEQVHDDLMNITSILDCIALSENNNIELQNNALNAISQSIKNIIKDFREKSIKINKHIQNI